MIRVEHTSETARLCSIARTVAESTPSLSDKINHLLHQIDSHYCEESVLFNLIIDLDAEEPLRMEDEKNIPGQNGTDLKKELKAGLWNILYRERNMEQRIAMTMKR